MGLNRMRDASSCLSKMASAFLTCGELFFKLVLYPQENQIARKPEFMMSQSKDHVVSAHWNHVYYP